MEYGIKNVHISTIEGITSHSSNPLSVQEGGGRIGSVDTKSLRLDVVLVHPVNGFNI